MEEDWDCPTGRIPTFASQIKILIVKHDESIDFSSFPQIHSLKLLMPTNEQCDAIQPCNLPCLKRLSVSNFFFSDHSEQLCRLIFSSKFSQLERFHIDRMTFCPVERHTSVSLRQLTLSPSTWKINHYPQILNACPNLFSLQLIRLHKIHFSIDQQTIDRHDSLRHLFIQFHSIDDDWFDYLDNFLAVVPQLQYFHLSIRKCETECEFPFEQLAQLLTRHLPNLISFRAKIPSNQLLTTKLHRIEQLHPLFVHVRYSKYFKRDFNSHLFISTE